MFLKRFVCGAVAAERVKIALKCTTYVSSSLLAVTMSAQLALAAESCEERLRELDAKYTLAYTNLSAECVPRFESQVQTAAFELSPECAGKYEAVGAAMSDNYNALWTDCQEALTPNPVEQPPVSQPTESSPDVAGPVEVSIPSVSKKCEERFTAIGDKFSAAYVNLDAECYPADGAAWCGYQLSPECGERYEALNNESNDIYNAYYEECYGSGWRGYFGITDSSGSESVEKTRSEAKASTAQVAAAPTKKEMLTRIKSLKKQLRRAKASNKKMRARCSK